MKSWKFLVRSILFSLSAGLVGSLFTFTSVESWYPTLNKPWFTPPSWVFGPAWTILYILMGLALYLFWASDAGPKLKLQGYTAFAIQLVLNAMWSIIFFGMKAPFLAFFELIFLWSAILTTMIFFKKASKPAVLLLVPYLLWTSFAGVLNFYIWLLN